jgi:hypothetical protein
MLRKENELDIESLVGLPPSEAREIAERYGYTVQVVGPGGAVTFDLRSGRVKLTTDGARVTRAWFG